jgi:uncharacterized protein YcbX
MKPAVVTHIYRYPVKGLCGEPLERVEVTPGQGLPQDRRFAIAHGSTPFDPLNPEWRPKTGFLMLMRNERLALLDTRFDEGTGVLSIRRDGKHIVSGDITTLIGRALIEDFFSAFMAEETRGKPRILEAPGHMFSDHRGKVASLINLESLRELERAVRRPVDHRRFRANFYFDGRDAWEEFDWLNKEIRLGSARLRIIAPIPRCAATNVNPETAERDLQVPHALKEAFGHSDLGVYAAVAAGGTVGVGDELAAPE